jgi:hypothetical protein
MASGYDPLREEAHWRIINFGIALGLVVVASLYKNIQDLPALDVVDGYPNFIQLFLLSAFCFVVLLGGEIVYLRSFRKARADILPQRASALAGTARIFPLPQLEVASLPVSLPYTIRIRPGFRLLLPSSVGIIGSFVLLGFFFFSMPFQGVSVLLRQIPSAYFYLLIFFPSLVNVLTQFRWIAPTLILDEESITARYGGDSVTMRWADVCSFAIIGQNNYQLIYELSDGRHVIRWLDVFTTRHVKTHDRAMKREDYLAQMSALPPWICARTELPLYDLRT